MHDGAEPPCQRGAHGPKKEDPGALYKIRERRPGGFCPSVGFGAVSVGPVEEQIREAAEYLDWSSMAIRIYGSPNEAVLEQMRQIAGSGVSVTVSPAAVGFDRFPVPEEQRS